MDAEKATRDVNRLFRSFSTAASVLLGAVGVVSLICTTYVWISGGWKASDFQDVLFFVAFLALLCVIHFFHRWMWKVQDTYRDVRRQPTPEDIEAARRMLYGDKSKLD